MNKERMDSIRESFRDQLVKQRRDNRLRAFSVTRKGVEDATRQLTSGQMTTLASMLKQKSKVNRHLLMELSQGLAVSMDMAQAFVAVEGSVRCLVTYFTGRDASLQLEAAYCLANLALWTDDPKLCKMILRHASSYLVILLSSPNPLLQQACTWTITNLLPEGISVLSKQHFLTKLEELAASPHDYVRRAVTECFFQLLATSQEQLQTDERLRICQVAVTLTKKNSPMEVEPLSWLIFHLSTHQLYHQILLDNDIISWLADSLVQVSVCSFPTLETITPLLRCIGNFCAISELCIETLLNTKSIVEAFVSVLQHSGQSFLFQEIAWVIGNIINAQHLHVQDLVRSVRLKEETEKYLTVIEHIL